MAELTRESFLKHCSSLTEAVETMVREVAIEDPRVETPLRWAESLRYATRLMATAGLMEVDAHDPAYPHFTPMTTQWLNWVFNNPDFNYEYATISGDHSYRIFGRRGSEHLLDVEIWKNDLAQVSTIASIAGTDAIEYGPNGEFEVIVSPNEQPGTWLPTPDGIGCVIVRQVYYDWEAEPSTLHIERIGATYPPPPPDPAQVLERIQLWSEFVVNVARFAIKGAEVQHYSLPDNTLRFQPITLGLDERGDENHFAFRKLSMGQGVYRFEPDQAVILEFDAPESFYWNVYLLSHFWEAGDFNERQTSINGHQAVIDEDGVFRAVIAPRDPGVPNWLDTAGHTDGLIIARCYLPKALPDPKMRVVPFDGLRDQLPATTPVVTTQDRSEQIRRRMHAARRRRRDY